MEQEKEREFNRPRKLLEEESEPNINLWTIFVFSSIFLHYFVTSFSYIFLKEVKTKSVFHVIAALDVVFVVDYIASLISIFWKKIKKYLKHRPKGKIILIIDFFLAFPYSYIYENIAHKSESIPLLLCLRAISLLRILHLFLFFKRKSNAATDNHIKYFTLQFLTLFVIFIHTVACVCYLTIFREDLYILTAWTKSDEWKKKFSFISERYISCIYFALMNITNRSYGDVLAAGFGEKIVIITIISMGFVFTTAILIGTLSFLLYHHHKRREHLATQLKKIKDYLHSTSINLLKAEKVKNYYQLLWVKKAGVHKANHLEKLPLSQKSKICEDMNLNPLYSTVVFRDKPEAFLRSVSLLMKHEFYPSGEIIYHRAIIKDKMIVLVTGTVEILSQEDDESPVVTFGPLTCLGESCLILTLPAIASVRAVSYVELQALYRRDFLRLADKFPKIFADIYQAVLGRVADAELSKISPENDVSIRALKDQLRMIGPRTKIQDKYLTLYNISNDKENLTNYYGKKRFWFLQTDTPFIRFWEYLIVITALCISIFYPYYVVFSRDYPKWFTVFSSFIDLILTVDVFIILSTTTEQTLLKIIRKRSNQVGFYLDFVSCVKLELFCGLFTTNKRCGEVLTLNRLLKAYRVTKFLNTQENSIDKNLFFVRTLKYMSYLLILPYWFGAFLYMTTCFEDVCFFTKIKNDSHGLTSVFCALSSMSGFTASHVLPTNITDMLMISLTSIFGLFSFSCCVSQFLARKMHRLKIWADFLELLTSVEHNLSKELATRVKDFFILQWHYDKGAILREQYLFSNASEAIQTEIELEQTIQIMSVVPWFQIQTADFLRAIAKEAKTFVLPPNELVIDANSTTKIIHIIQKGYCTRQAGDEPTLLGPNSFFGLASVFTNSDFPCTVRTVTHVKILCITDELLWKVSSMFPGMSREFYGPVSNFALAPAPTAAKETEHHDNDSLKGSFVNLISYCKRHNEDYGKAFQDMGCAAGAKIMLLPICILPSGVALKFWMAVRLVSAIVVALLAPYHLIQIPHAHILDHIIFVTDLIAYVDLYIMMLVGYFGSKNQLIVHPAKTADRYGKGRLIVDLIFCLPWEFLAKYLMNRKETQSDSFHLNPNVARIIRVGQIYRLPVFFNYLLQDIGKTVNQITNYIFQIIRHVPSVVVIINFWAAIITANSCQYYTYKDLSNQSYFQPKRLANNSRNQFAMYCIENSWIDKSMFRNLTKPIEIYAVSIYFATSLLTACGLGDVTPQYPSTLVLAIIIILCGILFFGYIYTALASHKAHWYSWLSKNQEMTAEIKHFMRKEKVSKKMRKEVINSLQYEWKRCRNKDLSNILLKLPPTLREEIAFALHENTFRQVPKLQNAEESFLRKLAQTMHERHYLKHEVIYREDGIVSNICLICKGAVRTFRNNGEEIILGSGSIFGNITPQPKNKISVTIAASTNVDIISTESRTFFNLLEKYTLMKEVFLGDLTNHAFIAADSLLVPPVVDSQQKKKYTNWQKLKTNIIACFLLCMPWKIFRVAFPLDAMIYKVLEICCPLLAYVNSILVTYEFAFQHHTIFLLSFAICGDLFFLVKILLDMHKIYENADGELMVSNRNIVERYFQNQKFRRVVDVLINLPFYYLTFAAGEVIGFMLFSSLRLLTLMRLLYFFEYYKKEFHTLTANRICLHICMTIAWSTLATHLLACIWYFYACPFKCFDDSWLSQFPESKSKPELYVTCVYFITTLITTTGTGDIVPNNTRELVAVSVIMVSAHFFIAVFIGDILNFLMSTSTTQEAYKHNTKELTDYLRNSNTSKFQLDKTRLYVQQLWMTTHGNQIPASISQLHSSLRRDLISEIYEHHIKNSNVFSDLEEPFTRQLCQHLKNTIFFPGNYIVQHGDFDETMYFIHSGEVEIMTIYQDLMETVHQVLYNGDSFGVLQGLFRNVPHHFSFRARSAVEVLRLRLTDWEYLLNFFPVSKESIYSQAKNVYNQI